MPAKLYNFGKPLYCGPNGQKVGISGSGFCCDPPAEKYRGLSRDAVELQGSAREEFLNKLKGFWKFQPLSEADPNTTPAITYTDVFVEGDKVILTGGMHNIYRYLTSRNNGGSPNFISAGIANRPQEQKIIPFRSAATGTTYIDNIGSMITRMAPDGSEIEMSNALGMRTKWVRPWILNGQANPSPNAENETWPNPTWNTTTGIADAKPAKLYKDGKPLYCGPNGEKTGIRGSGFCFDTLAITPEKYLGRYRGLPRDAVELKGSAREEFLNNLKGYWKLQPLSEPSGWTITYTDIYVEGDKVILTGGMHNTSRYIGKFNYHVPDGWITAAYANPAQEQKMILFHSAARGTTYIDNVGSMITRVAPDGSEIDINNALGMRVKWVRPWIMNGQANPNPNPNAGNATTGTADDELTKLEKLHKNGILSDEEYTAIKMRVVEKILSA